MKTVAEIIDLVEEYGEECRDGQLQFGRHKVDAHGKLGEIEAAIKGREAAALTDADVREGYRQAEEMGKLVAHSRWQVWRDAVNWCQEKHGVTTTKEQA
jgi:hypothetical protein